MQGRIGYRCATAIVAHYLNSGTMNQDGDRTEAPLDGVKQPNYRSLVRYINAETCVAGSHQSSRNAFRARRVEVRDRQREPVLGQSATSFGADAPSPACNNCDPPANHRHRSRFTTAAAFGGHRKHSPPARYAICANHCAERNFRCSSVGRTVNFFDATFSSPNVVNLCRE